MKAADHFRQVVEMGSRMGAGPLAPLVAEMTAPHRRAIAMLDAVHEMAAAEAAQDSKRLLRAVRRAIDLSREDV